MKLFHKFSEEGEILRTGISFLDLPPCDIARNRRVVYICIEGVGFIAVYMIRHSLKWRISIKLCLFFLNRGLYRTFFGSRFILSA